MKEGAETKEAGTRGKEAEPTTVKCRYPSPLFRTSFIGQEMELRLKSVFSMPEREESVWGTGCGLVSLDHRLHMGQVVGSGNPWALKTTSCYWSGCFEVVKALQ